MIYLLHVLPIVILMKWLSQFWKEKKLHLEKQSKISWNETNLSHFDPCSNQCEQELEKIIHIQRDASQLPDVFVDTRKATKSYVLAENNPTKIDVPVGQSAIANESQIR